ncbi:MAG TPA: hypothetical protein VMY76_12860 [Gemmatimonadales bacterium]|nr:hypothetical protein [Gemmatimonadales bacterium]
MLNLFNRSLLDPDGVHAHFRDDCPRVRRLHPGEMREGTKSGRTSCPNCTALSHRKKPRTFAK